MCDKKFKEKMNGLALQTGWVCLSTGKNISENYSPDSMFRNYNGDIIVCEQSSTGDRKSNLGELTQFVKYLKENNARGVLYIFTSGKNTNSSTPATLSKYLKPYYLFFKKQLKVDFQVYIVNSSMLENIKTIPFSLSVPNDFIIIQEGYE